VCEYIDLLGGNTWYHLQGDQRLDICDHLAAIDHYLDWHYCDSTQDDSSIEGIMKESYGNPLTVYMGIHFLFTTSYLKSPSLILSVKASNKSVSALDPSLPYNARHYLKFRKRINMETTFESSSESPLQSLRTRIALIEFIELGSLGFALWCFFVLASPNTPDSSLLDLIIFLVVTEGILLGSWAIYNIYIRVARAGGRIVDMALWVLASLATSTYTFWAWSILDLNRLLMAKLFYLGEAPVEFAWSAQSKQVRKAWEQAQKANSFQRI